MIALVPIVLAAAYVLRVFQGVMQGPELPDLPQREDMSARELFALAPIVVAMVLVGVDPAPLAASFGALPAAAQSASAATIVSAPYYTPSTLPPAAAAAASIREAGR